MDSKKIKMDEGDEGPPISWLPPEILCLILFLLDAKTLMVAVPQVCKFWRSMCQELRGVHLDFRWWDGPVPVEVLSGWRALDSVDGGDGPENDGDVTDGGQQQNGNMVGGLCKLFPHTRSFTTGNGNKHAVKDEHLLALAEKCLGITHANFAWCGNKTDAAVIALADQCRGITDANCSI